MTTPNVTGQTAAPHNPHRASHDIVSLFSSLSEHPAIEAGDTETIAASIAATAADIVTADFVSVWVLESDHRTFSSIARFSTGTKSLCPPLSIPADATTELLSTLQQKPRAVFDSKIDDQRLPAFAAFLLKVNGITSLLGHAIRSVGETVGLITFERRQSHRDWQRDDFAAVSSLANCLALTYANRRQRQALGAQHISEARLRTLSNNLPGAVYQRHSDPTLPFSYVSSGIERFTAAIPVHASAQGAVGWAHFIHPDDLVRVTAAYQAAIAGSEYALEYRVRHPDGQEMWVMDRGSISVESDGSAMLEGVLFNITPRKRAEQAAQSGASLQGAILNNVSYAVIATDAKGTITFFNRAAEDMLGYNAAELVGRQTPLIFHDLEEVRSRMQAAQKKLGRDILYPFEIFTVGTDGNQPNENEWVYIRKDGRRLTIRLSVTTIRAPDGELNGFLGIASDVSDRKMLASRLRQSEDIAARVLLQSPDAILITSLRDGRILEANPGFEQITGIAQQNAIGHSTIELGIWADLAERNTMIEAVRQSGEVTSLPIRVNQRGGTTRYCAMWARSFTFDGEPALLSVVHDVTDMRLATQAAQESQRMLQIVLDAIPSSVFWKDTNSVYLGCNRKFVSDSGIADAAAVTGKTDWDMPWRAGTDFFQAADRRIVETGIPEMNVTTLHDMPSGPPRWFDVSKLPLIDADGEVKGVLGIGTDVTDQRVAMDRLRASEEKLRALFETSPLGVTLTTIDGDFLEANDAFLTIIGYEREALPGLRYQMLTPPEFAASDSEHARIIAATGSYGPYEKEYVRKDGSRISVSLNGSMVVGPDGTSYVWSTIEDITLRRAAEEVQRRLNDELEHLVAERTKELKVAMEGLMRAEKLASLGSLVAGVAHEISTPVGNASLATSTMAGSIGEFERQMAEKLTRTALDAFVQQIKLGTDIANRNIERVASLIQSFKQVAVDQTSSQRRQFHLTEVVDEIVTTMHPSLKRSAIRIESSIPDDIALDSYPGPIGQVLTNLINNSLIHGFPAGRAGTIRISATKPGPGTLRLEIGDDGVGIPASVRGRIFDPFFTSKLGQGGSGLGLHIVHNIVSGMLAGAITVTSEEGKGTIFTLTLPLITPESGGETSASERGDL